MARIQKKVRHETLKKKLSHSPFMTDEDLAEYLKVSIQTVRLDRLALGIPELRERTKKLAEEVRDKIKTIAGDDLVGELIDLELGKSGISLMNVTSDMVFEKTRLARGHFVYAQANSLALAIIDAPVAVTGMANIKYMIPVCEGEKLIAKAEITKIRGNKFFITVKTRNDTREIFRAKFIIVSIVSVVPADTSES